MVYFFVEISEKCHHLITRANILKFLFETFSCVRGNQGIFLCWLTHLPVVTQSFSCGFSEDEQGTKVFRLTNITMKKLLPYLSWLFLRINS